MTEAFLRDAGSFCQDLGAGITCFDIVDRLLGTYFAFNIGYLEPFDTFLFFFEEVDLGVKKLKLSIKSFKIYNEILQTLLSGFTYTKCFFIFIN